jgi:hypothetical protein
LRGSRRSKQHKPTTKQEPSPNNVYYRGWFDDVKEVARCTANRAELGKCGFIVDFSTRSVSKIKLNSSAESMETASFQKFWRLAFQTLRSLCLVYLKFTDGYPYMMAGALHKNPSKVTETSLRHPMMEASIQIEIAFCFV